MKTLTLLRHAKSAWDDPVARDFDRPLNRRGEQAARVMGREMRALGLGFDLVLASPALRVKETLAQIETGYGVPLAARFDRRLYLAPASLLLDLVHDADDSAGRLLLVGHNPGLEELALLLAPEGALAGTLRVKYPTATLAEIALDEAHWRDVAGRAGRLTRFLRPRDLDPALGPDS